MTRAIDKIIVHCSDSPDDRTWVDVAEITRWHQQRGFKTIGYHYVVTKSGEVQAGRDERWIGAHCLNHNLSSIGICWVGRHDFNASQRLAMISLLHDMCEKYSLEPDAIFGHSDFDHNKTCPNIDIKQLREELRSVVKGHMKRG